MGRGGEGDTVVTLAGFRDAMRFQPIAEVQAYWEALRAGRPVPLRSEVDPRGIERALEYAFILERVAPQIARFRLAGMHLTDLMGMEVRGMPLTAFFTPEARPTVSAEIEAVFQGPQAVEFTLGAEIGMGKPALEARLLVLPLRSDLGDVSRALGCLVAEGTIGRTPRRFEIARISAVAIEAGRPVERPDALPPGLVAPTGLAEAAARFTPAAPRRTGQSRTHLRLVKSDD